MRRPAFLFSAAVAILISALPSYAEDQSQSELDNALIRSVGTGQIENAVELLRNGASPNATDRAGRTALHHSAMKGGRELIRALITAGADVNANDDSGRSPLLEAVNSRDTAALTILLDSGAIPDEKAMGHACWLGREKAVELMLDAGANADGGIVRAAQGGHVRLLSLLIKKGANVNSKDSSGLTALQAGSLQGGTDTVKLLLKEGADPNAIGSRNQTALHMAISGQGSVEAIKLLVESGARLDTANNEGVTPVRLAAIRGNKLAYEWLLGVNDGKEPQPSIVRPLAKELESLTIKQLLAKLDSRSRKDRLAVQSHLVALGIEVMPEALRRLESGEPLDGLMELFIAMGPQAETALPALVGMLAKKDRVAAARLTMDRMKPGHFETLPVSVRKQADEALYLALIDPELRAPTIYFAHWLSDESRQKLIASKQPDHRFIGISSEIKNREKQSSEIEAQLIKVLLTDSELPYVRQGAIRALSRTGKLSEEATAALFTLLRSAPPYVRNVPDEKKKEDEELRRLANEAGRALGMAGPAIINDLLPLLTPIDNHQRPGAMTALAGLGHEGVPHLIELLEHADEAIAVSASVALNRIGPPAIPALVQALESDNDKVVEGALSAIWWIGPAAKDSVPQVRAVLTAVGRSDLVRLGAARAIFKLLPHAKLNDEELSASLPALTRLLYSEERIHQLYAARTLGKIGPNASSALPTLKAIQAGQKPIRGPGVHANVREAIQSIETEQPNR